MSDLATMRETALNIYRQACRFRDSGMNLKALKALNQAIALDKNLIAAYFLRAKIFIKLGRHLKAQCDYYTVTLLDPTSSEAYYLLADLCLTLRQYDSARSYLEQGIELSPSADSYLKLARLLEQKFGEHELANKYFVCAIIPKPTPSKRINAVCRAMMSDRTPSPIIQRTRQNQPSAPAFDDAWQRSCDVSWEFLYEITEKAFNMLTDEDREIVHRNGKILAEHGITYTHVVTWLYEQEEEDIVPWGN